MSKNRNMSRLSKAERQSVIDSGSIELIEAVKKGDHAQKQGKYTKEAKKHRFVQERLSDNGFYHRDDESLDSYAYNSAIIHVYPLVKRGQQYGLTFERMFSYRLNENPNYSKHEKKHNYDWRVPDAIISTGNMIISDADPKRNSYLHEYRDILDKKKQVDINNAHKYKNILGNTNDPFFDRKKDGLYETNNSSGMSAMDKWIDDYEKRNGLPRSYQKL